MSDPARGEALVQAEIAATGKVKRHGGGRRQAFGANASDETGGGDGEERISTGSQASGGLQGVARSATRVPLHDEHLVR